MFREAFQGREVTTCSTICRIAIKPPVDLGEAIGQLHQVVVVLAQSDRIKNGKPIRWAINR
jgi:hypothetical protein